MLPPLVAVDASEEACESDLCDVFFALGGGAGSSVFRVFFFSAPPLPVLTARPPGDHLGDARVITVAKC